MRDTDGKPIISNNTLVKVEDAEMFPSLDDVSTLDGENVTLPEFFVRGLDAATSCTLVAISYKDYGYKLLPTWLDPFENEFSKKKLRVEVESRVSTVKLAVTEGGFIFRMLKGLITSEMKRNTPEDQHKSYLAYFGNADDFRDNLRMHNTMTCYVVLLDGFGRVRWMGSGEAAEKEVEVLLELTNQLISPRKPDIQKNEKAKLRVGRKSLRRNS